MSFLKRLYSRKFFVINLVLVGVLIGFTLAYTGFSRSAAGASFAALKAEAPVKLPPEAGAAILQAEAVQNAFRYVAEAVQPSVVEINVVESKTQQSSPQDQLPWRFFFGPDGGGSDNSAPREYKERGTGSGVIVRRSGDTVYVLTNNHVAGSATEITIILADGREFKGELVGVDERKDIAIVKFQTDAKDISIALLGDSSALHVGDWAIAIGSPLGLVSSVTTGIVSALGRSGGPDGNISDFIQTDAAINKGNSGGALVNIRGEVVGINTWIASPTGGSIGLGFAIPINNVKKAIDDIITNKKVEYGWLGISMRDLDKAVAKELGADPKKGVLVSSIFKGGPAEKGGFLPGDVVLAVGKIELSSEIERLSRLVGDLPVGKQAQFTVLRDGKKLDLRVIIDPRDSKVAANESNIYPGIDVLALSSEAIRGEKIPAGQKGVFVANLLARTPAATVGLKAGDIITEVNEKAVASVRDFYRLINDPAERKVSFTVLRDGNTVSTLAYVKK